LCRISLPIAFLERFPMKFTKATVASLIANWPAGKEVIFDEELRGFGLRRHKSGNYVWVC
jgi:hypothetical protein